MLREIRSVNHMYKDRVSFITKKKKKHPMTLEDSKADFIINVKNRDHCKEIFQGVGRKNRLNRKYSMGEWEFSAKEHRGGQRMENS